MPSQQAKKCSAPQGCKAACSCHSNQITSCFLHEPISNVHAAMPIGQQCYYPKRHKTSTPHSHSQSISQTSVRYKYRHQSVSECRAKCICHCRCDCCWLYKNTPSQNHAILHAWCTTKLYIKLGRKAADVESQRTRCCMQAPNPGTASKQLARIVAYDMS